MRSFLFLFTGPAVSSLTVDRRKLVLGIQTAMTIVVFAFAVAC